MQFERHKPGLKLQHVASGCPLHLTLANPCHSTFDFSCTYTCRYRYSWFILISWLKQNIFPVSFTYSCSWQYKHSTSNSNNIKLASNFNESCCHYLVCRLHALQDYLEQFNCHFLLKTLPVLWKPTPHPDEFTWKGNREKPTAINTTTKTTQCVRPRGVCRRTDRCQCELPSLSCVSALNNLSSTLVKLGVSLPRPSCSGSR